MSGKSTCPAACSLGGSQIGQDQSEQVARSLITLLSSSLTFQTEDEKKKFNDMLASSSSQANPVNQPPIPPEYVNKKLDGSFPMDPKAIIGNATLMPIFNVEKTPVTPAAVSVANYVTVTATGQNVVLSTRVVGTNESRNSTTIYGEISISIVSGLFEEVGSRVKGRIGNPDSVLNTLYYEPVTPVLSRSYGGTPHRLGQETELHIEQICKGKIPAGSELYWEEENGKYISTIIPRDIVVNITKIF
jgi:hypothetical protein